MLIILPTFYGISVLCFSVVMLFVQDHGFKLYDLLFSFHIFTKILGLRPRPGSERDKVCLSFFVSEDAMDLSGLMLRGHSRDSFASFQNGRYKDIYFIYWLAGLAPVYNQDDTYKKFIDANNWINLYLPNLRYRIQNYSRDAGKSFSKFYYDVVEMLFGGLERIFKKIQLRLMPNKLKSIINKDTRVVVNDHILKLHVNDRREKYREKYIKKISGFSFVCR